MRTKVTVGLAVATFAAGVGAGVLGHRHFDRRPDQPMVDVPLREDGALLNSQHHSPQSGLYTDDEVQRIIKQWSANDPTDRDLLRVVPAGKSAPLVTVFGALGLDAARLEKPSDTEIKTELHHLAGLIWQLSPSYELFCLTEITHENKTNGYSAPERLLYGVRIRKRR